MIRAGVDGGVFAGLDFNLNDPNDDTKLRGGEFVTLLSQSPLCLFDISGEVSAGLGAHFKVGWGPFSYTKRWDSPRVKLGSFSYGCASDETPSIIPVVAGLNGNTVLLYMGAENLRTQRNIRPTLEPEIFKVKQSDSTIAVSAFEVENNEKFDVAQVNKIQASGDTGRDVIELDDSVTVPAELSGGSGGDFLKGGRNNDLLEGNQDADELHGASGNDTLRGDQGIDVLYGDSGNDELEGGSEADNLDGGSGNDRILGGDGDDYLIGRSGADTLKGGDGFDVASYDYEGVLSGVTIDFQKNEFTGDAAGDTFESIEQIAGSRLADKLVGYLNKSNVLDGDKGDDVLVGGNESDNLIGGPGADSLDGGDGVDAVSYRVED